MLHNLKLCLHDIKFDEFEESDGCLYENSNYKYQYEKQKISEIKWSLNIVILIILT